MSDKQTAAMLDKKLDEKTAHTMFICGIVMVIAVLNAIRALRVDNL